VTQFVLDSDTSTPSQSHDGVQPTGPCQIDTCFISRPRKGVVNALLARWKDEGRRQEVSIDYKFVIFVTKPSMECLECMLACVGSGCVVLPINWRWSIIDMMAALEDMVESVVGVVVDDSFQSIGSQLYDFLTRSRAYSTITMWHLEDMLLRSLSDLDGCTVCDMSLVKARNDVAFAIFTSGTSSKPKCALLTHDSIIFQCEKKESCCGYGSSDVYLHASPLFHVGGLVSALAMIRVHAGHVFMPSPHFDAPKTLDYILKYSCTCFIAVPTMMADLVNLPGESALKSVKRILIGAGGLSPGLFPRVSAMFPNATLYTAYGMTEACSSMTYLCISGGSPSKSILHKTHVGQCPEGIDMSVMNEQGKVLDCGEGELLTKGRHVFFSYYGKGGIQDRRSYFIHDARGREWFRTGDVGIIQGSDIWLSGRVKDIIKSGGENVSAAEVEHVLQSHPEIKECSVFAIPDARWGEAVSAAIVLREEIRKGQQEPSKVISYDSNNDTYVEIKKYCSLHGLSSYKVPKYVLICSSALPRNATGKILKTQLQNAMTNLISHSKLNKRGIESLIRSKL